MSHTHNTPEEQVYDQDIRRHLAEDHNEPDAWKPGTYKGMLSLHNRHHPDHKVTDVSLGTMEVI